MDNKLVEIPDEIVENIFQFNKDLEIKSDIVTQISMFRHWYFIPELCLFGPSKYVGYKKMNVEKYSRGENKNGGGTEGRLKKWFNKISKSDAQWQSLFIKLKSLLHQYDKKPNKKVFNDGNIHFPNENFYKNLKQSKIIKDNR